MHSTRDIVAPLWTDLDNRRTGRITYAQYSSGTVLQRATNDIRLYFPQPTFDAQMVFVATWYQVAYYQQATTRTTVQAVLISGGRHSFMLFNYGDIAATSHATQAGYDTISSTHHFTLPGSFSNRASGPNSLIGSGSNVNVPGRWAFQTDNGPRGCTYNDDPVQLGDSFWTDRTCSQKCTCTASGLRCRHQPCAFSQICQRDAFQYSCQTVRRGLCTISGDPHYVTFDGKLFHFQGTCTYVLSEQCGSDLPYYRVEGKNEHRGSTRVSWTRLVKVHVDDQVIEIVRGHHGQAKVNGVFESTPLSLNNGSIQIYQSGFSVIVSTVFGLEVSYDANHYVKIGLPYAYQNATCGLCGNFNQRRQDDFRTREGQIVTSDVTFANSWRAQGDDEADCGVQCAGIDCASCPAGHSQLYGNDNQCGIIQSASGPFAACHQQLSPQPFMDNCIFDLCAGDGYQPILCQALNVYATQCQQIGVQLPSWRRRGFCEILCPENSHFESQGSGCPNTCASPNSTHSCPLPAQESCVCDAGYILSGGACVPNHECGCSFEGRYYRNDQTVLLGENCERRCSCSYGSMTCQQHSCGPLESCSLEEGERACRPRGYQTCWIRGPGSYQTFDGLPYQYPGACRLTLSKVMGLSSHPHFMVTAEKAPRGQQGFSRLLKFEAFGKSIAIEMSGTSRVTVDGQFVRLPFSLPNSRIQIYHSSVHSIILHTSFGVTVQTVWPHFVRIKAPGIYNENLGGLCGNFNGNQSDEFQTPNGNLVNSPVEFGDSWRDGSLAAHCVDNVNTTPNPNSNANCSILASPQGPFTQCWRSIDPVPQVQTCRDILRSSADPETTVCEVFRDYVLMCQQRGIDLGPWRNATNCEQICPANSHYESCGSSCPSACPSLSFPYSCDNVCQEGCQCDDGFVLNGDECVRPTSCGCYHRGQYREGGEQFWDGEECQSFCTCNGTTGMVYCTSASCGPQESCGVVDGRYGCHPNPHGICSASGDPHYRTFDGKRYDFQGTCRYVLAKPINITKGLHTFLVEAKNEQWRTRPVSITSDVFVTVWGFEVHISRSRRGMVQVNGVTQNMPILLNSGRVSIYTSGRRTFIDTDFGLTVTYDGWSTVTISVPSIYSGQMGGLCGNFNGNPRDDFQSPSGMSVRSPSEFGTSWKVPSNDTCSDGCGASCPRCNNVAPSQAQCQLIRAADGPFSFCHEEVDPTPFFNDCVFDVCISGNEGGDQLCRAFEAYVSACQSANVRVYPWRQDTPCRMDCPANSHYELCGTDCAHTCASSTDATCTQVCSEGCFCNDGFLKSGRDCVPVERCGCQYDGFYYNAGDTFWTNGCTQHCECHAPNDLRCSPESCTPAQECAIQDGVLGCYDSMAACIVWGDPHYFSFDGAVSHFQGTCSYVISESLSHRNNETHFKILATNKHRRNNRVSFVSTVDVVLSNGGESAYISIRANRHLKVNDVAVNPPVTVGNLARVIRQGRYIVVDAVDLRVQFDGRSTLIVRVGQNRKNRVTGMCGNFNGVTADDKAMPNGNLAANDNEFGDSWKAATSLPRCGSTDDRSGGGLNNCSNIEEYSHLCSVITNTTGPFRDCHHHSDPATFYSACVYDLCLYTPANNMLCSVVSSYEATCSVSGSEIEDWRTPLMCDETDPCEHLDCTEFEWCGEKDGVYDCFCDDDRHRASNESFDIPCPENSHFEFEGSRCPETCISPNSTHNCSLAQWSCVCDSGYILSDGACVLHQESSCSLEGRYYQNDQTVLLGENCERHCRCSNGSMTCQQHSCGPHESCSLEEGERACRPRGYQTCWIRGPGSYQTFDGLPYQYPGACRLTLSKVMGLSSHPHFMVTAEKAPRGQQGFSRLLKFEAFGKSIAIEMSGTSRVTVDGQFVRLPFSLPNNRIQIYHSSVHSIILHTSFGVTVQTVWPHFVRIKAPGIYNGTLGGLCGNFNGNQSDEFQTPNGNLVNSPVEFGDSWRDGSLAAHCVDNVNTTPNPNSNANCSILASPQGPFTQCWRSIDPVPQVQTCRDILRSSADPETTVCEVFRDYVLMCQQRGIDLGPWRNATNCEQICPANSHYESCGSSCPSACPSLSFPYSCDNVCQEGCQCDDGFVLNGDECVRPPSCGCYHQGYYREGGEQFWDGEECQRSCTCNGTTGMVHCTSASCGPQESCGVVDGRYGCHPNPHGICSASGDPHYRTFDGKRYDFQGTCRYVLAKPINITQGLHTFLVEAKNEQWRTRPVSITSDVFVTVWGFEVHISRSRRGMVQVNGVTQNMPILLNSGRVSIYTSGRRTFIDTDFGLTVTYDGWSTVTISVPSIYSGQMGGLCGNFNGNPRDDFQSPSGMSVRSPSEFGTSWKVPSNDTCSDGCGSSCPRCNNVAPAQAQCQLIRAADGPFSFCHEEVDPTPFFNDCVFDVCISGNEGGDQLCRAFEAYVSACQSANVRVYPWRQDTPCRMDCPANSHYELCGTDCAHTCASSTDATCTQVCSEGCFCNDGFLKSGRDCVPVERCGCQYDGFYYNAGDTFWTNGCTQHCECHAPNDLRCSPESCTPAQECAIQDGVLGCYDSMAACIVWGDPHYFSFDGAVSHFQGTCSYVISESLSHRNNETHFKILATNKHRRNNRVSFVSTVDVVLSNGGESAYISIRANRHLKVNDVAVNPPVTVGNLARVIRQGRYIVVDAVDLRVQFDGRSTLIVRVGQNRKNRVKGMCGNFNGVTADDKAMPNGNLAANDNEFGDSWKAATSLPRCGSTDDRSGGGLNNCSNIEEYSQLCSVITNTTGPFRDCHHHSDPATFYSACVYDLCLYTPANNMLCSVVSSYEATCSVSGSEIEDWRTPLMCDETDPCEHLDCTEFEWCGEKDGVYDCFCDDDRHRASNESFDIPCPENSHFEFEGSRCPETCISPNSTHNCSLAQWSCVCDSGYILSDGACVLHQESSCSLEGRYYQNDQTVLLGENCERHCRCSNGSMTCQQHSCGPHESCSLEEGERACRPRGYQTCWIRGPGSYQTFDGLPYQYPGACRLTLSKVMGLSSHPHFMVTAEKAPRGQQGFSRLLKFEAFGKSIAIEMSGTSRVTVDGQFVRLPFSLPNSRIQIYHSSVHSIILHTSFGVTVQTVWPHFVRIKAPGIYNGTLGGLCGNFNGNQSDEFQTPNGNLVNSPVEFGDSWRDGSLAAHCVDNVNTTPNPNSNANCSILASPQGPFTQCWRSIDPVPQVQTCRDILRSSADPETTVCEVFRDYVLMCQQRGIDLGPWRNATNCEQICPANSHYESCGSSCPSACPSLSFPYSCDNVCQEGCQCDDGFVLNGDECVRPPSCGCYHQGYYREGGEQFWDGEECQRSCTCNGTTGMVHCTSASCGPQESCGVVDGRYGCHPNPHGICSASGDPHYRTFDGKRYDFQGTCRYVLAKPINITQGLHTFLVEAKNEQWRTRPVSITSDVFVTVWGFEVHISRSRRGMVQVNGVTQNMPILLNSGRVSIYTSGRRTFIDTDFGLTVTYDGWSTVTISVPSIYSGQMGGLCGNFNGNPRDDFQSPSGMSVRSPSEFGTSWKVPSNDTCSDGCGASCPRCNNVAPSQAQCQLIRAADGPFSFCHEEVDPTPFFNDCVFDVCISGNEGGDQLCRAFEAYVSACQSANVRVYPWRQDTPCRMDCPANSHYELCGTDCAHTCASSTDATCTQVCSEGCFCNDGFLKSGRDCVPVERCGCQYDGFYYNAGDTFWTNGCTQHCECHAPNDLRCSPESCTPAQECAIQDGVLGCYDSMAACIVWGDPHYFSFDGAVSHFQGTCSYVISESLSHRNNETHFKILATNKHRRNNRVSFVSTVDVVLSNGGESAYISIRANRHLKVNDVAVNPPVTVGNLARVIRQGRYIVVDAVDLRVQFDGRSTLIVRVGQNRKNRVTGMCGNFNGVTADDKAMPNGNLAANDNEFGDSWKAATSLPRCGSTDDRSGGGLNNCSNIEEYSQLCSVITNTTGPFRDCHHHSDPATFYNACVYDLCLYTPANNMLCSVVSSYEATCSVSGSEIEDWRTPLMCDETDPCEHLDCTEFEWCGEKDGVYDCFCDDDRHRASNESFDIPCPENSHFEFEGSRCPETCISPNSTHNCSLAQWSCVCDSGYILSDGACVLHQESSCSLEGRYYQNDQTVLLGENCERHCRCSNGSMTCQQHSCGPHESCSLEEGERACRPRGYQTCWIRGPGSYQTFDGLPYQYPGACRLTLSKVMGLSSHPHFMVTAEKAPRGQQGFSRLLKFEAFGKSIAIEMSGTSRVTVDGQFVRLPFSLPNSRIQIYHSSVHSIILHTSFGVTVQTVWPHFVRIKAPGIYNGTLGGLCGNFNGNQSDEFQTPNGNLVNSPVEFGDSWRDGSLAAHCVDNVNTTPNPNSNANCSILASPQGPFTQCWRSIDPVPQVQTCRDILRSSADPETTVCEVFRDYVLMCQQRGIDLGPWRNATNCEQICPANSHYESCGSSCPSACPSLSFPYSCDNVCQEGCQCDDGFVLNGDECVRPPSCGCYHQGYYREGGEQFWDGEECQRSCTCNGTTGMVHCTSASCGPQESCGVVDGRYGCHPNPHGICSASGDPHYRTFDGKRYDFQGTCRYVLAKPINITQGLHTFLVEAKNEQWRTRPVSITSDVFVTVWGFEVHISRSRRGMVQVNGVTQNMPILLNSGRVSIYTSGRRTFIDTDFGLTVTYDGWSTVTISVPSIYSGQMGGLCGNFNGNPRDDFQSPSGMSVRSPSEFGTSWKVPSNDTCSDGCGASCPRCNNVAPSQAQCQLIRAADGPFSFCHEEVDPTPFFNDCVFDVCISGNEGGDQLCRAFEAYVSACQSANVRVYPWRQDTPCRMDCPANSHYELCGTDCAHTCASSTDATCTQVCSEGCFCNDGFLKSGRDCVPVERCGCQYDGFYYNAGDTFWTNGCTQHCECHAPNDLRCSPESCTPAQECAIQDGVLGCYDSMAACIVWGDPHYFSFDGAVSHFQGTCSYVISESLSHRNNETHFKILATNKHRRNNRVSFVSTVDVVLSNGGESAYISIRANRHLKVNDVAVNPPVTVGNLARVIRQGRYIVVDAVDLRVQFDGRSTLIVRVGQNRKNRVTGMCGNFNGVTADDKAMPNGNLAANDNEFGDSWKAATSLPRCGSTDDRSGGGLNNCSNIEEYSQLCSVITNTTGPFRDCHHHSDPATFYSACVYDLCLYTPANNMLCSVVSSYEATCSVSGSEIEDWRTPLMCDETDPCEHLDCTEFEWCGEKDGVYDCFCDDDRHRASNESFDIPCPENSHFEFEGSRCPETCISPNSTHNCSLAQWSCVCDSGYILSDGACVLHQESSCSLEGRYYQNDQTVLLGENCERHCRCSNGSMTCQQHSCGPHESCSLEEGERACRPRGYQTCWIRGPGSYQTFDGLPYQYPGACRLTLSKVMGLSSHPHFMVTAEKAPRGQQGFSRLLKFEAFGKSIAIEMSGTSRVTVDGQFVRLPFSLPNSRIQIYHSSVHSIILHTSFGVTVQTVWPHFVRIKAPGIYNGTLGGLCGNFNGNQSDEFQTPNGNLVNSPVEFGDSWRDGSLAAHCVDNVNTTPNPNSNANCSILASPQGPFTQCWRSIDPVPQVQTCRDILRSSADPETTVCEVFRDYVLMCQQRGIDLGPWRNATNCEQICPANSHYESCGSSCPSACPSLSFPYSCDNVCQEGCQCDDGFVLNGDECVRPPSCGCYHQGYYREGGEQFWDGEECQRSCTCNGTTGMVHCTSASCGPQESCGVVDGRYGCHPNPHGICSASGDPHYRTFDGKRYDFQGTCRYVLAKPINITQGLHTFLVEAKNEQWRTRPVSITSDVFVTVWGFEVHISRSRRGMVQVNGVTQNMPILLNSGRVSIYTSGRRTFIDTDFGLTVTYDGWSTVTISVPSIYSGQMGGLCGNFNGNPRDDFQSPSGMSVRSPSEFGTSWKVPSNDTCSDGCGASCPRCNNVAPSQAQCQLIRAADGPFSFCHEEVDPTPFFNDCVFDVCISGNEGGDQLCRAFEAYVSACQSANVRVYPWRQDTPCRMDCPANSHYELCGTDCAHTCASSTDATCTQVCSEGCFCNDGFLKSGRDCVPVERCGCQYDGFYYNAGDTFWTNGCTQHCECHAPNDLRCSPESCTPAQECAIQDGVLGCYDSMAACIVWGDPHYFSFDGAVSHFQGTCSYVISESLSHRNNETHFKILATNKHRRNNRVSFVSTVDVVLSNGGESAYISIRANRHLKVNDVAVNPPVTVGNLARVIRQGRYIVVDAVDLRVQFDGRSTLIVRVGQNRKNRVTGMCGNFNGVTADDKAMPNGNLAANDNEFGDSWKAATSLPRCGSTDDRSGGGLDDCSNIEEYSQLCSVITNTTGPFRDCHHHSDPATFYNACVHDLCLYTPANNMLCSVVSSYEATCSVSGSEIEDWRTPLMCDETDPCEHLDCTEFEWCGEKDGVYGCFCDDDHHRASNESFDSTITCDSSSGTMSVSRCQLFEAGYHSSSLHLRDASCNGTIQDGRLVFNYNNDDQICGTTLRSNGTHFIYKNTIQSDSLPLDAVISRERGIRLHFCCEYPLSQALSMSVGINPVESVINKKLPRGQGQYRVRMIPYRDATFWNPVTSAENIEMQLNERLFVEVRTEGVDARQLATVLDSCWATPVNQADYPIRWDLIVDE
ncbi:IgGFc-binding protein-like [Synchiropus splendidus]|uniref:IgGFc-binding protein-like n=1 Tax=Synchiropus splendidus TaxID=270530 RepID=UPI00237DB61E|nr:IgGFc-binding protein-like [Synchiropus splendidus]